MKDFISFWLPAVIFDLHVHGRDMLQSHKTTILQVMKEALASLVSVMAFMPNTKPELSTIRALLTYRKIITKAKRQLKVKHRQ